MTMKTRSPHFGKQSADIATIHFFPSGRKSDYSPECCREMHGVLLRAMSSCLIFQKKDLNDTLDVHENKLVTPFLNTGGSWQF
ncbi:MAG: hypothetical protein HY455_01950 [Parcubacteria group bacterium]|nr:hypothetical protein [Parcubacteria group bacterium]